MEEKMVQIVDGETGEVIEEKKAMEVYGKCRYCGQMVMINPRKERVTKQELEDIATEICECPGSRDAKERKYQIDKVAGNIEEMADYVTLRCPENKEYLIRLMKCAARGIYEETIGKWQIEYDGYKISIQKVGVKIRLTCKQTNVKNMEA